MNATQRAFTLIELLVVIAIIGILSAVILAGLNQAQTMARDRARLADMRALITALELAKDTGNLPTTGGAHIEITGSTTNSAPFVSAVSPYLPSIPSQTAAAVAANASNSYRYCNKTSVGDGFVCEPDTDLNTYAIRFYTEARPLGGPNNFYCATSQGIEPASSGQNLCTQR